MKIVHLELLSWEGAIGGEHYYATLHYKDGKGEHHRVELHNVLTKKMADYLNVKDSCGGWKKGQETRKFNTVKEAVKVAQKKCKELGVEFDLILRGTGAILGVSYALHGDKEIVKKINKLYEEAESLDWIGRRNEEQDKKLDTLDEKFKQIIGAKNGSR